MIPTSNVCIQIPASMINIPRIPYISEKTRMRGGPKKNPTEAPEYPSPLASINFLSNQGGIPDNTEFSMKEIAETEMIK